MLKEADVKRDTLAELGRGRLAQQEEQVPPRASFFAFAFHR